MARARNIKPGFFSNDELADIQPLGRLLFIGLWTIADREGRMEDRPRRIKAEILPYDDCDVDALLSDLHKHGFILRYEVCGERFIQVVNFVKHQNPHVKESASAIPAPGEHHTSPVQESDKEQPEPEQAGLIPDSGFRIPDSGLSDSPMAESRAAVPAPISVPVVSAAPAPTKTKSKAPAKTAIPADFEISDAVRAWAEREGHARHLKQHFEYFVGVALAKGYTYANWDQAFMNAIRANWAKIGQTRPGAARAMDARQAENERRKAEFLRLMGQQPDSNVIEMEPIHATR